MAFAAINRIKRNIAQRFICILEGLLFAKFVGISASLKVRLSIVCVALRSASCLVVFGAKASSLDLLNRLRSFVGTIRLSRVSFHERGQLAT